MKKISIIAISVLFALSLAACGRRDDTPNTNMTILPTMDPTIQTNIPDPDIDTKMPMYTDGTNGNEWTDPTIGTGATNSPTARGY